MEKGRIAKLRSYWHKSFFSGQIRWLLQDEEGNSVSCDRCGNIANGVMRVERSIGIFNVPLCRSHIHEQFPFVEGVPCTVKYVKAKTEKQIAHSKRVEENESIIRFIFDVDWMGTKEFCEFAGFPVPYFSKDRTHEEHANDFIRVDAIRWKRVIEFAKDTRMGKNG